MREREREERVCVCVFCTLCVSECVVCSHRVAAWFSAERGTTKFLGAIQILCNSYDRIPRGVLFTVRLPLFAAIMLHHLLSTRNPSVRQGHHGGAATQDADDGSDVTQDASDVTHDVSDAKRHSLPGQQRHRQQGGASGDGGSDVMQDASSVTHYAT